MKTDERGYIIVDDELRTSQPHIYALGDCNGRGAFTHTAYNDFEIVAANLLDGDSRRVSDRKTGLRALYRPAARPRRHDGDRSEEVGPQSSCRHTADDQVGRAVERGETKGFMKIVADADTSELLGAHCSAQAVTRSCTASST